MLSVSMRLKQKEMNKTKVPIYELFFFPRWPFLWKTDGSAVRGNGVRGCSTGGSPGGPETFSLQTGFGFVSS